MINELLYKKVLEMVRSRVPKSEIIEECSKYLKTLLKEADQTERNNFFKPIERNKKIDSILKI